MQNKVPYVRFAPSPTGPLHVGALRTALFNYLFAKGQGGHFLLRIEDTDRQRFMAEAVSYIEKALAWIGIEADSTIGSQAAQKQSYQDLAKVLHDAGKAYYAFDTPEELEAMRARLKAEGADQQHYNALTRTCMRNELTLSEKEVTERLKAGQKPVLRFKVPLRQMVSVEDKIRGHIHVHSSTIEDKVIVKSDGMPTYHFAHVVDDHRSGITHVIRGEEWLPSTPFHVLLYAALDWQAPIFAHLPLLLKSDGKGKLSKRDAAAQGVPIYPFCWKNDVPGFKEMGFLPDALFNFLACLGWKPKAGEEILDREALLATFSLEDIAKAGAHFDINKLRWYNQQYIKKASPEGLSSYLRRHFSALCEGIQAADLLKTIALMQPRVALLPELLTNSAFLRSAPSYPRPLPTALRDGGRILLLYLPYLEGLGMDASPKAAYEHYLALIKETEGISLGQALRCLRFALSAELAGPDLRESVYILGIKQLKKRCLAFIKHEACP